ncbi:MAG TPA: polysaccharide biosynthesis tyrosine autokinase [bacterium]
MNDQPRINNGNGDEESSLHLRDLYGIFLRRRRLFFYLAIPVFLGIIVYRVTRPYNPAYMATFDLGVSKEQPVEGFFNQFSETPTTQIGSITQRVISTLLSVNFTSKVVDTLSLCANIKNGGKTISDIDIRTRMKSDFQNQLGPYKLRVTANGYSLHQNSYTIVPLTRYGTEHEVDLGSGALTFSVTALKKITRDHTYTVVFYPRDRMALALRNSTSINVLEADRIDKGIGSGEIPGSGEGVSKKLVTAKTLFPGMNLIGILRINLYWGNPQEALKIARALSAQIIKEDIGEKSLAYIQSRTFIESQLALYQNKLTELEDNIKIFKETKKIVDLQASTQALISQVSALESRKNQIQVEEQIIRSLNRYLVSSVEYAVADTLPNFAATLLSSPALQNLYNQFFQAEAELKGKLKEYSNEHPKVLEIRAKLDGIKGQMKEEISRRMSTISTEIASVERQISLLQDKLENVPVDELSLARLERDRETAEKLYTFFAEKLEETRVQEAGVTSDLKIINPPLVSGTPVNSRGRLTSFILALVISILVGGAGIFIAEYFDNTVKDLEVIKTKLGLSIFASIPLVESNGDDGPTSNLHRGGGKRRGGDTKNDHVKQGHDPAPRDYNLAKKGVRFFRSAFSVVLPRPQRKSGYYHVRTVSYDSSAEFESFRKLSLNIEFAHPDKHYQVVYVTSAGPEEGKTYVSLNLGVTMSAVGKKVVVVDTDFRKKRGHLTDVVKMKKEIGLFDVLQGKSTIKDAVVAYKPEYDKNVNHDPNDKSAVTSSLSLLPVGSVPPNPFVFLESVKMNQVLDELRKHYDYVIIDGLPMLLFADATYSARSADAVLLTARYGRTVLKELQDTKDILTNARANVIGMVLNGVPLSPGSYYYQSYYKYYSKYYRKEA